jgi:hypothetical protein
MITATSKEKDLLNALIMSINKERPRNACICNWPDCATYHLAFKEKSADEGDEGDDPWYGKLKQVRISQTVKSKAFCYAITHHLGTVINPDVDRFYIAPYHFARTPLKQFSHLQNIVS